MKRFIIVVFIILLSSLLQTSMTRSTVIHYTLEDEVESKSFVGSLARDTPQLRLRNDTDRENRLPGLHFLFLSSPHSHFFHLDGSSGDLYTASKMDRDVVCASSSSDCQLELNVQIKAEHFSSFVKVLIKMKDANDNSPVFSKQSVHLNLSEAEIVGRKLRLAHASDADGPDNGIKRFLLRPEEEEFGLHYNNNTRDGIDGQGHFEIFLVVRKPLDRELRSTYQLNLIAEDHGDPPRKAILPLTIVLSDVNDNAPVFERDVYHAVVEENSPIGTSVIHVLAKDDDLGEAGEVIYGLEKKLNLRRTTDRQGGQPTHPYEEHDEEWNVWTDEEIGGPLFRIDRGTGLIYVSGSLDREKVSQHVLSVSARDLTSSRSKSVSLVKIEVSDVNDNDPMISSQFSVYNVTENCGPRTFVGLLTVSDLDSAENTRLSCTTDNPIFVLEPIISNQYQLVTSSDEKHLLLDRESQKEYQILITCSDGSFPPLTGSLSLAIQVLDRNDNKPKFEAANYSIRLLENYLPDGAVIRAIASDEDEGANGMVRYRLEAPQDTHWYPRQPNPENGQLSLPGFNPSPTSILSHFEVNEKTGALKVIKPFDREQVPMVKLLFAAYDLGTPPQTSYADVIIFIDDVDDEKPTFTRSNYTFSVLENQPPGALVGTVQAYDADETPFNSFHYFIHRSDIFRVDPSSGSLTTLVSLDRELIDFYVFDIFACPTSGEDDCTSSHVTVRIADENDNPPRLIFPAAHLNFTLVVTNSFQYGDKVTKIMAEDDDEPGPNSRLLFQAVDTTYFGLNSTSGMVTASRTFAVSGEGSVCEFPVVIRDSGDPPKSLEVVVVFIFNSSVKSYFDLERENNEGNFYIVICIAVASAFLSTILVIAILFVARKQTLPPSCDVDKKSERTRVAGKKKKEHKSSGKNSNSASLKLRCQQPLPAKGAKNKNNKTKKKKSSKEPMNTCSDAPFTLNNGCLRNKNKAQSLEDHSYPKGEETDHIGSSSKLTHFPNLTTPSQDRLMGGDGDPMFIQNMPQVVDKTSTMHQPLISKQRYLHNPVSATTLTTNKLPTRPQVPLRSSGTMTLGCYGDRVPHHVNNSFRQAPTEVKFKPEVVTKDPHYFTNCTASASLPQPNVCYPSSEAKLSFGSFV